MLRGINVGGHKKIRMQELKELYESLGYREVQTYIQSGNVIFRCADLDTAELKNRIESAIQAAYGYSVAVLIRIPDEFRRLVENNPLSGEKDIDFTRLAVIFLSASPEKWPTENLEESKAESEDLFISGREIYLYYPEGYAKTKLSISLFEKQLKVYATARNWRTVQKLRELAG